ncbi:patched family protein, partial [Teladorsagia circumcincta]
PIFDTYFPVNIYVNHPPNISDEEQHASFYKMVSQLEQVKGAYGKERTMLFLNVYEKFDKKVTEMTRSLFLAPEMNYKPSLHNLQFWLDKMGNPPSIKYVKSNYSGGEGYLKAFSFVILGKGMAEWANRAHFVHDIRQVLSEHPRWNASLFDGDSAVLGLILTVGHDLIGSIAATVACMAGICLLFVNSRLGVVIITYTITSICFCLVGLLSWWGADLDPVTQVDVLLATGFSVDYTAHVAYQFYRSRGSAQERVANSLREMAAPMVQAGLSTFLCMLPLIFVPTYAINAFAKTIFIVVGIGLIHGLFVLPVLLSLSVRSTPPPSPLPLKSEHLIEQEFEQQ